MRNPTNVRTHTRVGEKLKVQCNVFSRDYLQIKDSLRSYWRSAQTVLSWDNGCDFVPQPLSASTGMLFDHVLRAEFSPGMLPSDPPDQDRAVTSMLAGEAMAPTISSVVTMALA